MRTPDLSLLTTWTHSHAWYRLDEEVATSLQALPCASARIQNSIKFLQFSAGGEQLLQAPAEDMPRLREGFLRAALTELVSVEDVLPLDLATGSSARRTLRMNDSPLPLLHLVRELRNHELHLYNNPLSTFSTELLWGHVDRPSEARPLTVTEFVLEGITPASFAALRNARSYTQAEIEAMVGWFDKTQRTWGVQEVLLRAANDYAAELCREFVVAGQIRD